MSLPVGAETLRVPTDYATILAAADAAESGDVILVAAGTYSATDTRDQVAAAAFLRPGVTLKSEGGRAVTRVEVVGTPRAAAVLCPAGEGATTTIEGFTFVSNDFGIWAKDCAPLRIVDCQIEARQSCILTRATSLELDRVTTVHPVASSRGLNTLQTSIYAVDCSLGDIQANAQSDQSIDFVRCQLDGRNRLNSVGGQRFTLTDCSYDLNGGELAIAVGTPGHIEGSVLVEADAIATTGLTSGSGSVTQTTFVDIAETRLLGFDLTSCTFVECGRVIGDAATTVSHSLFFETSYVENSSQTFVLQGFDPDDSRNGCNVFSLIPECFRLFCRSIYAGYPLNKLAVGDITADPVLCDPDVGDYTIANISPAAPANSNGCGLIGAYDVGCEVVSVDPLSWGQIKSRYR